MKKQIFFISLGEDYIPKNNDLNDSKKLTIESLSDRISKLISGANTAILSSDNIIAKKCSEIISKKLCFDFEVYSELSEVTCNLDIVSLPNYLNETLEFIKLRMDNTDELILVLSEDLAWQLPYLFSKKYLNIKLASYEIGFGKAWVINYGIAPSSAEISLI